MSDLTSIPDWQVWLMHAAPIACEIYMWILMATGFVVSIFLARRLRIIGFYLIAIFFLSPVFALGARKISDHIHRERIAAYVAEQNLKIESGENLPVTKHEIRLPIFETFLVAGLLLVIRRTKKSSLQIENQNGYEN